MQWVKDLFNETSGVSCMRFMAVLALFFGFIISVYGIFFNKDLTQVSILTGVFVGAAFGGKIVQKFGEK